MGERDAAGANQCLAERKPRTDRTIFAPRRANMALLRRRHLVELIHQISGVRGFWEFLEELIRHGLVVATEIEERRGRYVQLLDPQFVNALGADQMPHQPIRAVGGRQ